MTDKENPSPVAEVPSTSGSALTAPPERADEIFLEGPRSRFDEFITLLRVIVDFLRGFRVLHFVGPCVTVFGSARVTESSPDLRTCPEDGFRGCTPGVYRYDGRWSRDYGSRESRAKDVNGRSVGCGIVLPNEQKPNAFLDRYVEMNYFFVRKTLLIKYSYAFVVMPGGAGTLDELFEALTLIQTHKIRNFPIVIMGTTYWKDLIDFVPKMAAAGMINQADINLLYATDSVDEAIEHIREKAIKPFGLTLVTRLRRHMPWLGERSLSPGL